MITITPNVSSPNLANQMRFPPPQINPNLRVPPPARPPFFQPFRAYRQGGNGPVIFDPEFDGKRLRKSAMRKTVDYNAAIIKMLEGRIWQRDFRDRHGLFPDAMYTPELLPPSAYEENPINAVTTRFVKTATNKMRCPIFCMAWTPEGRRLVTGASSGEFTLWNGLTFNFETILQAHDTPVRTMVWSHNEMWMVTADHSGYVKYWQSNMNNVKMFMAHQEPIRGISFSPTDSKFASCSDDGTVKIWDFYRCLEERTLRGHGADVKCVHWHPHKGLVISGSKDNQQPVKLWDPKTGNPLATIHAHKSTVMDIKWNNNGNWFVTASRDHLLKLFDIRNLTTEVQVFRGHKKESSSVAWHPVHEGLFCSGGSDGAILFWHVGADKEVGVIEQAHDSIVWTLAWHPMGHILCSGSNDHTSKFWTRNRPGDSMKDKYNLNTLPAGADGTVDADMGEEVMSTIPGMGPDDKVEMDANSSDAGGVPGLSSGAIPGLEDITDIINDEKSKSQVKKVPYSKPIPKNFQAQWNDSVIIDSDEDSKDGIDPVALLNQILEHQPGVKPVSELEPEALYIYGKVLTVESGSALAQAISDGGEKLLKYIHSGAIRELQDVIPHYETEDGQSMPYIIHDDDTNPERSLDASSRFPPLGQLIPGEDFSTTTTSYQVEGEDIPMEEDDFKSHDRFSGSGFGGLEEEEEQEVTEDASRGFRPESSFKRETNFRQPGNFRGEGGFNNFNRGDGNFRNEGGFRNEGNNFRNEENFRADGNNFRNEGGNFRNEGNNFRNEGNNFRNEGNNFRNDGNNFRNEGNNFRNEGNNFRNDFRSETSNSFRGDNFREESRFHKDNGFRNRENFRDSPSDNYRNDDDSYLEQEELRNDFREDGGGFRGNYRGKQSRFSNQGGRWGGNNYQEDQDETSRGGWQDDDSWGKQEDSGYNNKFNNRRGGGKFRGRGGGRWTRRRNPRK